MTAEEHKSIWKKGVVLYGYDVGGNLLTIKTTTGGKLDVSGSVAVSNLPSGNMGQQLAAASLSVVPGTNIADGTYIGSIKKSKGSVTTAHSAIADTATSTEISCVGFNSVLLSVGPFSDVQNWTFKIQGCLTTGGTFVDWYELANTGSMAAMSYQCSAARGFTFKGIPDYIKVVATRDGTASTVTVKVQPFNV